METGFARHPGLRKSGVFRALFLGSFLAGREAVFAGHTDSAAIFVQGVTEKGDVTGWVQCAHSACEFGGPWNMNEGHATMGPSLAVKRDQIQL